MIIVDGVHNYDTWRDRALELLTAKIAPLDVSWGDESSGGFMFGEKWVGGPKQSLDLPKKFVTEARIVACYHDPSTWGFLYRVLWRLGHGEKKLFDDPLDSDVLDFERRKKSVTKDFHKMKAFVRFKKTMIEGQEWFIAFHSPDHSIMRLAAPFFQERFLGMNWSIMTPFESAHWNGEDLSFSPGVEAPSVMDDDQENLWKTYYSSIFNPARIKIGAMKKEMAVRYWKNLPETALIDQLLEEAPQRLQDFYQSQVSTTPAAIQSFDQLHQEIKKCANCTICSNATAPVFGVGPERARLMLVGEQPGDEEDKLGTPFIGPAGKLLNRALEEVGFNRKEIFVTNAVKGFKWLPKEHQRWHRSANGTEISACRPWLKAEIELVKPKVLVCLGRSAAQSILGKMVKMEDVRGRFFHTHHCSQTIILPHPSSILRCIDEEEKKLAYQRFVQELQVVYSRIA